MLLTVDATLGAAWYCWLCLRSEVPRGTCAKLRTAAASNNRVHESQSLLLLLANTTYSMVLFFTHIPFVVNHTINATPSERLQLLRSEIPSGICAKLRTAAASNN